MKISSRLSSLRFMKRAAEDKKVFNANIFKLGRFVIYKKTEMNEKIKIIK